MHVGILQVQLPFANPPAPEKISKDFIGYFLFIISKCVLIFSSMDS